MELKKEKIYTVGQAAELLQIRSETILRKIYAEEIRASKVGRIWRITGDDIERYLKSNANKDKDKFLDDGDIILFDELEGEE